MKFSSKTLCCALALYTSTTTHAFTTQNSGSFGQRSAFGGIERQRQFELMQPKPLYSSTLERQDTEVETKNSNDDDDDDVLVVSRNHLVVNGRITEGGMANDNANSVKPTILFEDDEASSSSSTSTNTHDHDLLPSQSFPLHKKTESDAAPETQTPTPTSVNGIKMASAATAAELKGTKENVQMPKNVLEPTSSTASGSSDNDGDDDDDDAKVSFADRVTNSGVASAAAMATAAVNAAVSMKTLEAPDVTKSYISLDSNKELDGEGLPLVYDKDAIEDYWKKEKGALNKRWGYFVGKAVPFLTRLTTLFIKDGKIEEKYIPELSEKARLDLQDLGPTFIKAGQMMSVRPDVLPQVSSCSYLNFIMALNG